MDLQFVVATEGMVAPVECARVSLQLSFVTCACLWISEFETDTAVGARSCAILLDFSLSGKIDFHRGVSVSSFARAKTSKAIGFGVFQPLHPILQGFSVNWNSLRQFLVSEQSNDSSRL